MTTYVPRQRFPHGVSLKAFGMEKKYRDKSIDKMERDCSNIDLYLSPTYGAMETALRLDPEAAEVETWEAWTISMQVHNVVFALYQAEKGTQIEYLIDHKIRTLTAPGNLTCADASTWQTAFFLAVVCRDNARAQALCQFPVENMRQAANDAQVEYNDYIYHWVAALQAFVNGTDDLAGELRQAMELSDPEQGAFGGEALDLLVFPPMEVFRQLLLEDKDEFNQALVHALESYKHFHARESEEKNVASGIIPLSLLALACLAYDKSENTPEFALEVESEYLPKHFVQGSWHGEFPI